MTNTNSDKLKQLQAELERIYQEGSPINEMGDRVELNDQVRPHLSLDKIEEWVDSLPPEAVVGHTVAMTGCPVHRYLEDCGFNPAFVTNCSILGKDFTFTAFDDQIPKAVSKLIALVDQQGPGGTPITAQMLKGLLQLLQKEAEVTKNSQSPKVSQNVSTEDLVRRSQELLQRVQQFEKQVLREEDSDQLV